jgi:uncharacterized membrane protein (DUF2068 family)
MAKQRESTKTIFLIAIFKLFKGTLLLIVAIGALRLLHSDIAATVAHWVEVLRVDPDNHYIHSLMLRAFRVNSRQLKEVSAGTFIYSALFLTEGFGLLLRRRWAEFMTVISTALFIPIEVYELFKHFTLLKTGVLAINVAIVVYLAQRLRSR